MSGTLRVAVAGAGMVSRHHLIGWQRCPCATVIAIADPDQARARERAMAFGIEAVFEDVGRMLGATRPDALDIVAPMQVHGALVEEGIARGVAVMCQKPLAPTLAEARAIVATTGDRGRLMVHENWRFRPYYRQAREWIRSGRIGRPSLFQLQVIGSGLVALEDGSVPGLTRQPFFARMDRLLVLEMLVHHLDTLQVLVGPLRVADARLARLSPHVVGEDTGVILLEGDGVAGSLVATMAAPGTGSREESLTVIGTEGTLVVADGTATLKGGSPESTRFDPEEAYQAAYDNTIAHFADSVIDGTPFEIAPEDHLAVLALMEEIYRQAAEAQPTDSR